MLKEGTNQCTRYSWLRPSIRFRYPDCPQVNINRFSVGVHSTHCFLSPEPSRMSVLIGVARQIGVHDMSLKQDANSRHRKEVFMLPDRARPSITMLDAAPERPRFPTCPLCSTAALALTDGALSTGAGWQCARCGQRWDDLRLATAAAFTSWALEHEEVRHTPVGGTDLRRPEELSEAARLPAAR